MTALSFRAFFALDIDLARVAREAHDRAIEPKPSATPCARTVYIVRVDRMPTEPPMWLQRRPHWAVVVADALYHVVACPCDDVNGDISAAVCGVAWVSWISRENVQGASRAVGTTILDHNSVLDVLSHVVTAFGGDRDLHRLFWHAPAFMRTAAAALCGGSAKDMASVSSILDALTHDDDLTHGILALPRRGRLAAPAPSNPGNDGETWLVRSSCEIARHLPVTYPSLSSTAMCILY